MSAADLCDALEAWDAHRRGCEQCRAVRANRPATLALACVRGSELVKRALNQLWLHRFDDERRIV
jgi:hypothetical protein